MKTKHEIYYDKQGKIYGNEKSLLEYSKAIQQWKFKVLCNGFAKLSKKKFKFLKLEHALKTGKLLYERKQKR